MHDIRIPRCRHERPLHVRSVFANRTEADRAVIAEVQCRAFAVQNVRRVIAHGAVAVPAGIQIADRRGGARGIEYRAFRMRTRPRIHGRVFMERKDRVALQPPLVLGHPQELGHEAVIVLLAPRLRIRPIDGREFREPHGPAIRVVDVAEQPDQRARVRVAIPMHAREIDAVAERIRRTEEVVFPLAESDRRCGADERQVRRFQLRPERDRGAHGHVGAADIVGKIRLVEAEQVGWLRLALPGGCKLRQVLDPCCAPLHGSESGCGRQRAPGGLRPIVIPARARLRPLPSVVREPLFQIHGLKIELPLLAPVGARRRERDGRRRLRVGFECEAAPRVHVLAVAAAFIHDAPELMRLCVVIGKPHCGARRAAGVLCFETLARRAMADAKRVATDVVEHLKLLRCLRREGPRLARATGAGGEHAAAVSIAQFPPIVAEVVRLGRWWFGERHARADRKTRDARRRRKDHQFAHGLRAVVGHEEQHARRGDWSGEIHHALLLGVARHHAARHVEPR